MQAASVFIATGEASADWAAARLVEALRTLRPDLEIEGIGGRQMEAVGVRLLTDSSTWGAIGVFEALFKVPRISRAIRLARQCFAATPPSALVLIDCGAVNMRIARAARAMGLPILYYFPPGSWRQQTARLEIRDVVDMIATPFPWSRDLLIGGKARVEWVGHPLVEVARPRLSKDKACSRYGMDPSRPVVAIAPGSREQEIRYLLPVFARAAARLRQQFPGIQILMPLAPTVDRDRVSGAMIAAGAEVAFLNGMEYDALQLATAALVCSGSVTLEFACLGTPMVVAYRASRATTFQFRLIGGLLGGHRFAAMPNIIAGREVVPELLGSAANPEAIVQAVGALLQDEHRRARMRADLELVVATLGPPGASRRTAEMVLELIGRKGGVGDSPVGE